MSMQNRRRIVHVTTVLAVASAMLFSGCGIFGGGGGPKDRTLELTFVPSSKLNFDGTSANVVQVAVFVLTGTEKFQSGRVETFFDPEYDKSYYTQFAADTLGAWTLTLRPGQKESKIVRYNPGQAKRVSLGIIGDFFRAPGDGRERAVYQLENKEAQRLTITVGENVIESIKR